MAFQSDDPSATALVAADVAARILMLQGRPGSWVIVSAVRDNGEVAVVDFSVSAGRRAAETLAAMVDDLAAESEELFFEAASGVTREQLGFGREAA